MKRRQIKQWIGAAIGLLLASTTACTDEWDKQQAADASKEGDTVAVTLRIGLADGEEGYLPSTRSAEGKEGAFGIEAGGASTRASSVLKPDKLYNLEVGQYNLTTGAYMAKATVTSTNGITIGSEITLSGLQVATDGCQLVVVARGSSSLVGTLPTTAGSTLDDVRALSVTADKISALDPTKQDDMNKMPYVLHVKNVIIDKDGIISSPENGTEDVRLQLRRLAVRVGVNWNYGVDDYTLQRVLVQAVPMEYNLLPSPDKTNGSYPSLLGQFTTYTVPGASVSARNSYACWMPANVRGQEPKISSVGMRAKSLAPSGSTYLYFTAVNQTDLSKKLNYRVYLGGSDVTDFSLYDNTDYNYTVTFKHESLPVDDERVEIVSPVPASENNNNVIPTANCLMVVPGSAFCFDPYTYRQNGVDIENTTLTGWAKDEGGIASVKLLWQTKEDGDVGDPVVGVVNSDDDHSNIVEAKFLNGTDVSAASPLTEKGKGRIYCRVANTKGGSGVIAAYNVSGEILWSWHLWITEYSPDPTGDETVLEPSTARKLKFTYNNSNQLPMMDRNLGAMAGFTLNDQPQTMLDRSKANGLHYQWGRKDPFPGSYSAENINEISGVDVADIAPKGMLNRYAPDGVSYLSLNTITSRKKIREAYKNPKDYIMLSDAMKGWCDDGLAVIKTLWNNEGAKTLHDPCPSGWCVPSYTHYYALFPQVPKIGTSYTPNASNATETQRDGGLYLYFQGKGEGEASYFRFTGYRRSISTFTSVGQRTTLWSREYTGRGENDYAMYGMSMYYGKNGSKNLEFGIYQAFSTQDGQVLRCIQETQ